MHIKKNGYVPGALLMIPFAKKLRDHVEYEKFVARVIVDNETTREFKSKTDNLQDQIFALRYNNEATEKLTELERKKNDSQK